jgi:hypothetical protein
MLPNHIMTLAIPFTIEGVTNPDPDADPYGFGPPRSGSGSLSQRGTDPNPDPSIIKQKWQEKP